MRQFIIIFILALTVFASCVSGPIRTEIAGNPVAVTHKTSPAAQKFAIVAPIALTILSEQFDIELPDLILDFTNPPIAQFDALGFPLSWVAGKHEYSLTGRHDIRIYMRSPYTDVSYEALYHTLLHEFLHHLDIEQGRGYPSGPHIEEFEKRIVELKLRQIVADALKIAIEENPKLLVVK